MIGWMIVGMALVTFLTRAPMMVFLRGDLPDWLSRWLRFVPIAVFTALVVPPFVAPGGVPEFSDRLLILLIAALVAWRFRQVYTTIAAGLLLFALLQFLP